VKLDDLAAVVNSRLGKKSSEHLGRICPHEAERFALACPSESGPPPGEAHPLYAPSQMSWGSGPRCSEIRPDGTPPWVSMGLPLDSFRVMGAGQRLTLHNAIEDDADLTIESWVEAGTLKDGRGGPMLILEVARDFRYGERLIAECRETIIVRS
jgi:hypothetical protein